MTVCQYWRDVVEHFALYDTLWVSSADSVNTLINIIPKNASKVKRLAISLYTKTNQDIDLNPLLVLLPKLEAIHCTGPSSHTLIPETQVSYPWAQHIEYIKEYSKGSITSRLLQTACLNLKTLDIIDFDFAVKSTMINMLALRRLTISYGTYMAMDIEHIHQCCPQLESLTLRGITCGEANRLDEIIPSMTLTECVFDDLMMEDGLETGLSILRYIAKKYKALTKLTFTLLSDHHLAVMNNTQAEEEWAPLLRNVGPQLEYLCVDNRLFYHDTFDALDRFECQLNGLKINNFSIIPETISSTQQLLYLEYLCLENFNVSEELTFVWLSELIKLKRFKLVWASIGYRHYSGDILKYAPPTLKSLSLACLEWGDFSFEPAYINNIERLSIDKCTKMLHDSIITQCFPKLTTLKLRDMCLRGTYNLSSMNLLCVRIADKGRFSADKNILVITKCDGQRRRYTRRETVAAPTPDWAKDFKLFDPMTVSWPERANDPAPVLTLICHSLKRLIVEMDKMD
ncbi:hypothetical protein K501DRAFT_284374 [Backusella circina FSU 941]|nr:hypothetical protein K501DRAFT_284374 [Backusella circina FSU 941]